MGDVLGGKLASQWEISVAGAEIRLAIICVTDGPLASDAMSRKHGVFKGSIFIIIDIDKPRLTGWSRRTA